MNLTIGLLPDWYSSEKPGSNNHGSGETNKGDWYQRLTVKNAFRTAGLVRGPHAYALIVDDLQLDDQTHHYVWGMTLPQDVELGSAKLTSSTANAYSADIVLSENSKIDLKVMADSPKPRHLLVRVLSAGQLADEPGVVEKLSIANPPQPNLSVNRLHIASESVSPGFKILLFPYQDGDDLPETVWNKDHSAVTIAWPDQKDVITFAPAKDGRTRFSIARGSSEIAVLK
jgi:hypothetical protein